MTHEVRCRAAALIAPPMTVLTGRSAATVRGVPLALPGDLVELISGPGPRFQRRKGVVVKRVPLRDDEHGPWHHALRIASLERMAFDVLMVPDLGKAVGGGDALLRSGLLDISAMSSFIESRHDHGIVQVREALALLDPRAESVPESELRVLFHKYGMRPVPQVNVGNAAGFAGRVDLGFEKERVAVEYDGAWHGDPDQFRKDRNRIARLESSGWQVIVVTSARLREDPAGLVHEVDTALRRSRACIGPP